jgi:hypothetical protein
MEKKDFIKIINEEISEFDFLGNNKQLKEEENYELLKNEDLQKQFICDSLVNMKNIKTNVTDASVGGNWDDGPENASNLTIEYFLEVEYKYDPNKEPAKFTLQFYGDNVGISVGSDYDPGSWGNYIAPSGGDFFTYIDWNDINVSLSTIDGDEIEFTAFNKAPIKIQSLFIREFTENLIVNKALETNHLKRDKIQSIPYC